MARPILRKIKSLVNKSLAPIGVTISAIDDHDWSDTREFLPFERTMEEARNANLSVADYIDSVINKAPGSSQRVIDDMASLGVFSGPMTTVVEIGPGSGRYLEKTIKACRPSRYEIYETAGPWADYLVKEFNVVVQPTDGYSMPKTANGSADLVHAHKVFCGVPFIVTCCYWFEMARVIRPGGWAVFDIVTERCLDSETMEIWAKQGTRSGSSYPAVMPREVILSFFAARGFTLAGSFVVPLQLNTTELLAFKRSS